MPLTMDTVVRKSENIVSRKIADEYILVPVSTTVADVNSIYSLNEIAGFIWELLDGKKNVKEIHAQIMKEYDASDKEAEENTKEFLQQLIDIGAASAD